MSNLQPPTSNLQSDPIRSLWNRVRALGRKIAPPPLTLSLSKGGHDA